MLPFLLLVTDFIPAYGGWRHDTKWTFYTRIKVDIWQFLSESSEKRICETRFIAYFIWDTSVSLLRFCLNKKKKKQWRLFKQQRLSIKSMNRKTTLLRMNLIILTYKCAAWKYDGHLPFFIQPHNTGWGQGTSSPNWLSTTFERKSNT